MKVDISIERQGQFEFDEKIRKLGLKFKPGEVKKVFDVSSRPYKRKLKADTPKRPTKKSPRKGPLPRYAKGGGKIVAWYHSGNLQRSWDRLRLKRMRRARAILIGAKRYKGSKDAAVQFKGRKVDGFYAHIPQKGKYQKQSWESQRETVAKNSLDLFEKMLYLGL